jgi:hypothetical protein
MSSIPFKYSLDDTTPAAGLSIDCNALPWFTSQKKSMVNKSAGVAARWRAATPALSDV